MGALTKAEIAERLYEELGLNKREAKELVELFFEEIRQALEHNEQVYALRVSERLGRCRFGFSSSSQRSGHSTRGLRSSTAAMARSTRG